MPERRAKRVAVPIKNLRGLGEREGVGRQGGGGVNGSWRRRQEVTGLASQSRPPGGGGLRVVRRSGDGEGGFCLPTRQPTKRGVPASDPSPAAALLWEDKGGEGGGGSGIPICEKGLPTLTQCLWLPAVHSHRRSAAATELATDSNV